MKIVLSAAALFGLLLAASASNPAAATETYHHGAPEYAAPVAWTPGAGDFAGIIHVDDDEDDYNRYRNPPLQRYNQWPYPQQNNNWPYPQTYYGDHRGGSDETWRDRDWSNPWSQQYQNSHYFNRQPLPRHVIVHKLARHHFYHVQKIKAKKGYYKVYAFDRYDRPVSVIVDPYTGRILRVGPR
ncbi:MAG: PepSY domain-containing protein [Dongiaceae bacterium]